jgi:hypothetical protein
MGLFDKKQKAVPLNTIGQKVVSQLKDQDLICAILNSICVVDLGNMAIQNKKFPGCETCFDKFGEVESLNCIPDCDKCGRNERTAINIRSGVGDGVYPILGLCNSNWVEMGEIPPFKGFIVDFRQDMPKFYMEKAIQKRGFADINLCFEDTLNGVDIVNFGSIISKGQLYLTDILSTSNSSPVICDIACEPGEYALFAILDYMHEPTNPMPKVLIGIKKEFATKLEKDYPYDKNSKNNNIVRWNEASGFMLTGDHKSQCYGINYFIAENSARYMEAASWLVLGAEVGDEQCLRQLEEGINFDLDQDNYQRILSLRIP